MHKDFQEALEWLWTDFDMNNLTKIIVFLAKQVGQIESDLKVKSQAYNALKTSLQSMEKKQTGSLMTRNLGDLVKKEHFVLGM